MKSWTIVAVLTMTIGAGQSRAQDAMTEALRKGIVQEETQQNLGGAIQSYQAVLDRFDEARKTAATALLRMAECYRKQGDSARASAAYGRILREFADQSKVAEEARRHTAGGAAPATSQASARYRETLEEKVRLLEQQLSEVKKRWELGAASTADTAEAWRAVLQARRQIAGYDAGLLGPPQTGGKAAARTEARRVYGVLLQAEQGVLMEIIEEQKKQVQLGTRSSQDVSKLQLELLHLQGELASFLAGGR